MSENLRNAWRVQLAISLTDPACYTLSKRQKTAVAVWVARVMARQLAPPPPFDPEMPLPCISFPVALELEKLLTVFEIDTPWIEKWLTFLWLVPSDKPTGLARIALNRVVASLVETRRLENEIANPPHVGFRELPDDYKEDSDMPPSHPVLSRQDALEGPTFLGGMVPLVRTPAPAYNMNDLLGLHLRHHLRRRRRALYGDEGSQDHGC